MQRGRGCVTVLTHVDATAPLPDFDNRDLRAVGAWLADWTLQHHTGATGRQRPRNCIGQLGQIHAGRSHRLDLQIRSSQGARQPEQDQHHCGHYIPLLVCARDLAKAA